MFNPVTRLALWRAHLKNADQAVSDWVDKLDTHPEIIPAGAIGRAQEWVDECTKWVEVYAAKVEALIPERLAA